MQHQFTRPFAYLWLVGLILGGCTVPEPPPPLPAGEIAVPVRSVKPPVLATDRISITGQVPRPGARPSREKQRIIQKLGLESFERDGV